MATDLYGSSFFAAEVTVEMEASKAAFTGHIECSYPSKHTPHRLELCSSSTSRLARVHQPFERNFTQNLLDDVDDEARTISVTAVAAAAAAVGVEDE